MNRADVVTAAVEHAIPTSRLMMFADLAVTGCDPHRLAGVLAWYRATEVVTGGGHLVADDAGITMTGLFGGEPVQVTWIELTRYLTAILTVDRVDTLVNAYQGSLDGNADGVRRFAEARSALAYETVETAGLIPPSLFTASLAERTIVDGPGEDGGFTGRVTLDPLSDISVACRVNGQAVVVVSRAVDSHHVVARVHDGAETAEGQFRRRVGFAAVVRHVPPGESNAPLPETFAQRVGVEVLAEDAAGARWAVQIDGFDVVVMEAVNGAPATVRAAVYDNDPAQPFQRYEGHCTVSVTRPPRNAGAAVNRLSQLHRPPPTGPAR